MYPEPERVSHIVQVWKDDGLPANIPFFMTEGNMCEIYEWRRRRTLRKGLWLADYVGSMMTAGASGTFYFHYIPTPGRPGPFLMVDQGLPGGWISVAIYRRADDYKGLG